MLTQWIRRTAVWSLAVAAALPALTPSQSKAADAPATRQVVGYYEAYRGQRDLGKIDWQSLTRLNVAFLGFDRTGLAMWMVPDGKNVPDATHQYVPTVRALVAARNQNNPNVKLLLSVGGASMSNLFSSVAADEDKRALLAKTAVQVATTLGLDGVDWDWEYPGRLAAKNCADAGDGVRCTDEADYANFTKLLTEARANLATGQLQTAAVYFDPSQKGVPYDVPGMDAQLDAWNVMAYDMAAPSWSATTAFQAGVQAAGDSLDAFVKLGADKSKMILGVPFYSYVWYAVPWAGVNVCPSQPQGEDAGKQYAIADLFTRYANTDGCKLYESGEGDYYYCTSGTYAGEWSPVDSVRIIGLKGAFVRDNGYGGLMGWSVRQDLGNKLMVRTMAQSLR